MSNHIHLLITEPELGRLSTAIQVLKQRFSRRYPDEEVWEPRYHDFNVFTTTKEIEKLNYIHQNPVKAGLAATPADWPWSSFHSHTTQSPHPVKITTWT
jgi:putative transposase